MSNGKQRWAPAIVAIVALTACGKTSTGNLNPNLNPITSAAIAPAVTKAVTIDGYAFHPKTLTVKVGTTVKWTNRQNIDHTVTANGGTFQSGPISPGHSFSHKFSKAGKFAYHCSIHPFMKGSVVVSK